VSIPLINGEAFRQAREAKGLSRQQLAGQLCLKEFHMTQIEEGGDSWFYSPFLKIQTAKKVAKILGLPTELAFEGDLPSQIDTPDVTLPMQSEKNKLKMHFSFVRPLGLVIVVFSLVLGVYWSGIWSSQAPKPSEKTQPENLADSILPKTELVVTDQVSVAIDDPCLIQMKLDKFFTPTRGSASAGFVVFQSKIAQQACIIGADNQPQALDIKAGEMKVVYGKGPYTILSADLSKLDIYFQGWRVYPLTEGMTEIHLQENTANPYFPQPQKANSIGTVKEKEDASSTVLGGSNPATLTGQDKSGQIVVNVSQESISKAPTVVVTPTSGSVKE